MTDFNCNHHGEKNGSLSSTPIAGGFSNRHFQRTEDSSRETERVDDGNERRDHVNFEVLSGSLAYEDSVR